jgi:hypothetical protein
MATKLFVVQKQPSVEQSAQPEETQSTGFGLSGDTARDLQTALVAFAYLLEWVDSVGGAEGIRLCAEKVRSFREETR